MLPTLVVAENAPLWYNAESRCEAYPQEQYITGFAIKYLSLGEDPTQVMNFLIETARVNAASTIQVRIKNETEDRLEQLQYKDANGAKKSSNRSLQSITTSSVDLVISGLNGETFHDEATNRVAAFAYVKISDLIRHTDRKLTSVLSKIEDNLDETEMLVANGQILQANERGEKIESLFNQVEDAQYILIAIDPMSDAESLQLNETKKLKQRYILLSEKLRNSVRVYLKFTNDDFDVDYNQLAKQIEKTLSTNSCSLVSSSEQADWVISLHAVTEPETMRENLEDQFVQISVSGFVCDKKKQIRYGLIKSERFGVSKKNGGYKSAAGFIINRERLTGTIVNDIIEILKSK